MSLSAVTLAIGLEADFPPLSLFHDPLLPVAEVQTVLGRREEHVLSTPGWHVLGNTSMEFQSAPDRQTLRSPGPLAADFTIKVSASRRPQQVDGYISTAIEEEWQGGVGVMGCGVVG